MAWGLGRVGWGKNVDVTCNLKWCYARATSWFGVWVGWGGAITLMTHVACNLKWCYARATSWLGVWFGWGGAKTLMLFAISSVATLGLRHGLGFGWGRLKRLVQKWKTTIIPKPQNLVNTMKSFQNYLIFPGKNHRNMTYKMRTAPQCQTLFLQNVLNR